MWEVFNRNGKMGLLESEEGDRGGPMAQGSRRVGSWLLLRSCGSNMFLVSGLCQVYMC